MAQSTATIQKSSVTAGLLPTYVGVPTTAGDTVRFLNRSGKVRVHFKGATGATGTVKMAQTKKNQDGANVHAQSVASALDTAAEELIFGPFNDRYNDGDGYMVIEFSGTLTGVTYSVIEDADQPGV